MSALSSPAFLDSSYIVRYLTEDQPEMAANAAAIIDSERPLIVSEIVLTETAYVLASVYKAPRAAIVDALIGFLQRRNIRLAHLPKSRAVEALLLCRGSNRFSFTDVLLWAEVIQSDTPRLYTFDRRFPAEGIEIL
ncbi:MAG: type II toxin-antitoxin system VapC family toxin [Caldilineae bacterium]|nr:MAG: type II toxin-antitoxin system VapC family toxin [Caldilineae bacterium]